MTLENVKTGIGLLEEKKIPLVRPDDYFAEMFKSDKQMKKIKERLVNQQTNIDKFEVRKRRRQDQKFAKKIKAFKEQQKHKQKKKEMQDVDKWRKEIKSREQY